MANWIDVDGCIISEPGTYLTKIVAAAEGWTKNNKLILQIKLKTIEGNEFTHTFYIQNNTMFLISRFLRDLGLTEQERHDINFDKDNPELSMPEIEAYFKKYVVGKITEITLNNEEYNGKTHLKLTKLSNHFAGNEDMFKDVTGVIAENKTVNTVNGGQDETDVPF